MNESKSQTENQKTKLQAKNYYEAGKQCYAQYKNEEAMDNYQKALELDPDNSYYKSCLADIYRLIAVSKKERVDQNEYFAKAEKLFKEVLTEKPSYTWAIKKYIICLKEQSKYKEACAFLVTLMGQEQAKENGTDQERFAELEKEYWELRDLAADATYRFSGVSLFSASTENQNDDAEQPFFQSSTLSANNSNE